MLLTQIHRDLQKAAAWYPPAEFVGSVLAGAPADRVEELKAEIGALLAHPSLLVLNPETVEVCRRWDRFCHRLFHAYQDAALARVPQDG